METSRIPLKVSSPLFDSICVWSDDRVARFSGVRLQITIAGKRPREIESKSRTKRMYVPRTVYRDPKSIGRFVAYLRR